MGEPIENVDLFRLFNNHKRECEDAGDYETARVTQWRLINMRNVELERQQKGLHAKHEQEAEELSEIQFQEKAAFLRLWREEHLPSLFSKLEQLEVQLEEKQQIETSLIISSRQGAAPKFSSEVLNLEKRLKHVVQLGRYSQANEITQKINQLKKDQTGKFQTNMSSRSRQQERLVEEKQERERKNLSDRFRSIKLETAREEEKAYEALKKSHQRAVLSLMDRQALEKKHLYQRQQFLKNHFGEATK